MMAPIMSYRVVNICSIFLLLHLCCVLAKSNVVSLDEDNWEKMLAGEWMVEFYAPWCPACKALQPVWERFSNSGGKFGVSIGQVDVTSSPGLSGRFMVTALPTIFHVLDGEFRQYRGARDEEALISFIKDDKWKTVEAIPGWKSPGSIQMSVVSYFFKLSQLLRTVHNNLMEEYGLPTWGSYLIFACGTIVIGALLGLILVCIIDLIYPPKPLMTRIPSASQGLKEKIAKDHGSGDELEDGEDQDDLVDEVDESGALPDADDADAADGVSGGSDTEQKEGQESPNVRKRKPRKAD
ncbi:hypothetical protein R5R35_014247 [Gryllus longicercus]|uniref:Thioredoxin domain-containing protein n=2 Tax=Gryllus longicercus TaxID=2509291 RepID=A0AAN9W2E7_9ORTH